MNRLAAGITPARTVKPLSTLRSAAPLRAIPPLLAAILAVRPAVRALRTRLAIGPVPLRSAFLRAILLLGRHRFGFGSTLRGCVRGMCAAVRTAAILAVPPTRTLASRRPFVAPWPPDFDQFRFCGTDTRAFRI